VLPAQGLMVLSSILAAGQASETPAADRSGCVACHLDEGAITRSLAKLTTKKSALQSGKG